MVTKCPVCGKAFDVLWPQLWRYRENRQYICTWKCLRQKRKEEEEMAKMKKDGTPAKKPGPKPKDKVIKGSPEQVFQKVKAATIKLDGALNIETPEGEYAIRPGITTKPDLNYRIRSVETDLGVYSADSEYFEFKSKRNKSDAIEMELDDFIRLAEELPKVMRILGVQL